MGENSCGLSHASTRSSWSSRTSVGYNWLFRKHTGIEISSGKKIGGMLLADDFVGVSESRESLRSLLMLYMGTATGGD